MLKKTKVKGSDQVKVTFTLPQDQPHGATSLVGEFNDWNPTANKLAKRSNNTFSTTVTLDAGKRYAFRYYAEDGTWFNDEAADDYEGQNCIVTT